MSVLTYKFIPPLTKLCVKILSKMTDGNEFGRDCGILIMDLNKGSSKYFTNFVLGLSSVINSERCKTIAEFPSIIEQFPFPMIINSVFLKISGVFCEGL